ncbi:conserved hypothetical protein [Photorhabdus asymbiotica]|uniref:N-acetyltransferase domain-containing protein n=2 Tax=Photorhabdus asymbiotica TaxID=291112 RepID=B6VNR3_PHOAA|nr:GNAT family N-acetyltransferase [Photorhabdus asymbiotica]CAQ85460.1 conserved hypothetical protein [Photorhabdus asymbiotica]CAR67794.1 Hypothetical Protein PA-RVA20-21-0192 [Photorhabdus asymbiotica subsp. asymbiotica ATCC 43949]
MNMISELSEDNFQVKIATPEIWLPAIDMARRECWDLGREDARRFFNVDANGFYIGYLHGQPVSSVSVVNYAQNYSHLGHYIVNPAFRGKGLGLNTWRVAIEHAEGRCIGLDGMPAQEKNYQKWGFVTHYQTLRVLGTASKQMVNFQNVETVNQENILAVVEYDSRFMGYSRLSLLSTWFFGDGRKGFIITGKNGIEGLIGLRPSDEGYRIGPFYAGNKQDMKVLMSMALNEISENTKVTLDIPEYAHDVIALVNSLGFKPLFYTCRMYRGNPPVQYHPEINALASLELG